MLACIFNASFKILNPRVVKMGVRYAVTGESEETGIAVFRFVGGKKPTL